MNRFNWLGSYIVIALALVWYSHINRKPVELRLVSEPVLQQYKQMDKTSPSNKKPYLHSQFVSEELTNEVHSATATPLSNGDLLLFWYGGKREGSADVTIFSRRLNTRTEAWSPIKKIVERMEIVHALQRNIRKLGNPVAFEYAENEIWLFYVSVSVGGWAGSAINLQKSYDNGKTWQKPTRLVTSPFFNISTLVKERPIRYQDGSIGLPIYHEFIGKFSELLHLDSRGEVLNKYRLTSNRQAIQPVLIPLTNTRVIALMRNVNKQSTRRLWYSESDDGGKQWLPIFPLKIPNPNAAVSVISHLRANILLMAFNNHPSERNDLSLGLSLDEGKNWHVLTVFEQSYLDDEHNPFSYPFLIRTEDQRFHLFYTWKRKKIKYISFNQEQLNRWVEDKQLGQLLEKELADAGITLSD